MVDASRATARDIVLIALAGPAASLAGFVVSGAALSATPSSGVIHGLLWAATLGGVFACLVDLIPMTLREHRSGPRIRTDGRLVLDAVRVVKHVATASHAASRPLAATPSASTAHEPLRGRGSAPLGVEPMRRTSDVDPADDGLARRARRLSAYRERSVPPPGK